jgi:hypothetical protein
MKQIFGGVVFSELEYEAQQHEWTAGFTAKDMRLEITIYSPSEMALMPWRGILKGVWYKIINQLKTEVVVEW